MVGTGFDSLLKQLVVRFENLARKSSEGANKRKRDDASTASNVVNKKKNFDTYGCINYLPTDFPPGETTETLKEVKNLLKEKYLYNPSEEVEELMNLTYILQRKDILETDASIIDLRKEWPFLFEQSGMFTHFEILTGIKLPQKLENSITKNSEHIIKWMKEEHNQKIRNIYENLQEATIILKNKTPVVPAIIASVMSHFKDNEKFVYLFINI